MKSVINTRNGISGTIKAHYHKAGVMNFLPIRGGQWGGDLETAIVVIYENNNFKKYDTDKAMP